MRGLSICEPRTPRRLRYAMQQYLAQKSVFEARTVGIQYTHLSFPQTFPLFLRNNHLSLLLLFSFSDSPQLCISLFGQRWAAVSRDSSLI
jgi:hypothetical protein